jgi:hypothetical protein
MVNKFGETTTRGGKRGLQGKRGAAGEIGPPGKRGSRGLKGDHGPEGERGVKGDSGASGKRGIDDMCKWIPGIVLSEYRENESCCFLITDPSKDLEVSKAGAYVTWISRSTSKINAVAIHPSENVLHISENHDALVFNKSLYKVKRVPLLPYSPSYAAVCVTYQVEGDQDQTILSSYDPDNPEIPFREISASNKEIRIWGMKTKSYVTIKHKTTKTDWTTVFVEWHSTIGSFIINNREILGTFTCQPAREVEEETILVGGRFDCTHPLKGAISALDIYTVRRKEEDSIPDPLKNLIISSQLINH